MNSFARYYPGLFLLTILQPSVNIKVSHACGKLVALVRDSSLRAGSGTPHGWYLSTSVDKSPFNKVNSELLGLALSGTLQDIIDRSIGGDKKACAATKLAISPAGPVVTVISGLVTRQLVSKTRKV